ncbi:MAG: hypothetical protein ACI9TY_001817 [Alphaproteobacteria bacterium]|jgi:hypothetical protein
MDIQAYKELLDIILAGVAYTFHPEALVAFVLCLIFTYTSITKESAPLNPLSDFLWVSASALFVFSITAVVLFALQTPMTVMQMTDDILGGLTIDSIVYLLSSATFIMVAAWYFIPTQKAVSSNYEDEDLSAAPFMAILFGAALAVFVFMGADWPAALIQEAQSVDVLKQGVFYALAYMIGFIVVWLVGLAIFYAAVGRFLLTLPSVVGGASFLAIALFQVCQAVL